MHFFEPTSMSSWNPLGRSHSHTPSESTGVSSGGSSLGGSSSGGSDAAPSGAKVRRRRANRRRAQADASGGHRPRRSRFETLETRQLLAAEIEPNNTLAQATFLPDNDLVEGALSSPADVDFFRIQLQQGERFQLNPFNVNAPLFSPTLPPGLEIFDADANLMATSHDGSDLSFVAAAVGTYYLSISAGNDFGMFVGEYGMRTTVSPDNSIDEPEPNGPNDTPSPPLPLGRPINGRLLGTSDVDRFAITAQPGDVVVVSFAGLTSRGPATQILDSSGNVLASDTTGRGLAVTIGQGGNLTLQLQRADSIDEFSLEYNMVAGVFSDTALGAESGSTLSSAFDWEMERPTYANDFQQRAAGVIGDLADVDVFRFEINSLSVIDFRLRLSGSDAVSGEGKSMTLYNQYGQYLADSNSGGLSTQRPDAFAPGVYFLAVAANSPIGLGAYSVEANFRQDFSPQRDPATHYLDFDSSDPHLGFERVGPHAIPEAREFYIGAFDAKFAPYDVDVVTQRPVEGNERVAQGVGDFGDIGAGGFGGGGRGQRSSQGNAVTSANETVANRLRMFSTNTVNHEFGHAVGLPHARDVQAMMSYVGRTEYLPTGSNFAFQGTDSRQPGEQVNNHRNYLDWSLQAGAQVIVEETADGEGNDPAISLDRHLKEMTIDHRVSQTVGTTERPVQVMSGDFNNDGRDDVATLIRETGQLLTYLTAADGTLGPAVTTDITTVFLVSTESMSIADFNNDGRDDIAIGLSETAQVTILIAGVGGVFAAPVVLAAPDRITATTTADLNGDGSMDIAATTVGGEVIVYSGTGAGTFGEPVAFATVTGPVSLDAGDYDGDGDLDLLVVGDTSASVSLHRNLGTGDFVRAGSVSISEIPIRIAVADFNADTAADFAVVAMDGAILEVYQSFANGEFGLLQTEIMSNEAREITIDDVNNDGAADLLVAGWRYSASVLLGDNTGGFTRPIWTGGTGWNEVSITAADLDGDGVKELITTDYRDRQLSITRQTADNPANDKVVVFGALEGARDVDRFTFDPAGETRWDIDIDAAEFQMPLDAVLTIRDNAGNVIARNDNNVDRQSGIFSVDPYVRLDFGSTGFIPAGLLTIEVTGVNGSSAGYRLKLTPGRAMETGAPRVIAIHPDSGEDFRETSQVLILMDDIIDSSSIDNSTVRVTNAAGQRISGTARVNPLDASLVWTATTSLPIDTYTITLNGITDFNGNRLDGETPANFQFPLVSGDGVAGGAFVSTFRVTSDNRVPAVVLQVNYERDPYQRGLFTVFTTDQLSLSSVRDTAFTLRGAGADGVFGSTDDTTRSLDAVYDSVRTIGFTPLNLYSRGIPDSGTYRIEGSVMDTGGNLVTIADEVVVSSAVPASALFRDISRTQPGLTGSYVNESLRLVAANEDWRETQTIVGTRVDNEIAFTYNTGFGTRADVGITGGTDEAWGPFSVQWDGYIAVPAGGVRLLTRSDDGSRLWIDLDRNGVFGNIPGELADNQWGTGHSYLPGDPTGPLAPGVYPIRIQYEDFGGDEAITLEWVRPGRALVTDGLVHGPAIVGTSIASGTHRTDSGLASGSVGRLDSYSVTFSGAIAPNTLTTDNLRLRRSDDSRFFDAFDEIIADADGVVQWDPATLTATLNFASPLRSGFYLLEANGEVGGITNTVGTLLDGEFLSNHIPGNIDTAVWTHTPSGDGIAGGTYRSTFSYSPARLSLSVQDVLISENGGSTTVTLSRLFADTTLPMIVGLTSSDRTELSVPPNVTIPAGAESVSFIVNAIDDILFDGTQRATITARATGIESGDAEIGISDFESLQMTFAENSINERGGVTELILTRNDPSVSLVVSLTSSDNGEAVLLSSVTFAPGERSIRVPVTAIDDQVLDGTQLVTITSTGLGLVEASAVLEVTDFETLVLELGGTTMSEFGGVLTGTLRRSDPNGRLVASVFSDPAEALLRQQTVEFLPGRTQSQPFQLNARDNLLLDGGRNVSIIASAGGYQSANSTIVITDYEALRIVFEQPLAPVPAAQAPVAQVEIDLETGDPIPPSAPEISERDGVAIIRIERTDARGSLEATLTSDSVDGVSFASAVRFADGRRLSDPIEITAVDNDFLTGTRTFTLTAMAENYIDAEAALGITDYEELTTSIVRRDGSAIPGNTVAENADTVYLRVTLPRAVSADDGPLTVLINTTSPQSIDVQASATIRPGDLFVDVPLDPINNDIVGGDRSFLMLAEAAGYVASQTDMSVTEDDVPRLTASLQLPPGQPGAATNSIPEASGRGTLVLTRNTISETTVRLSSSLRDQLQWPSTIVFPRGFRRIEVPITTIDNGTVDGDRGVDIIARATGHPEAFVSTTIVDNELAGIRLVDSRGNAFAGQIRLNENSSASFTNVSEEIAVTLNAAPITPVRLQVNASPRLNISLNDLTFTPSNWNVPQIVRVRAIDDMRTTGDAMVRLSFEVVLADSDIRFGSLPAHSIDVTITDDDRASLVITETLDNTYASELGLPADQFTIALGTQPTGPVTLTFDNSAIDSVSVQPSSITFTPLNWDQPQTLDVVTDLDFNADGHDIGLIYIDVTASTTAVGYPEIGRRRLSVIHVDSDLADLHIRREGDEVALYDETTGNTLLKQPLFGGRFQTGSRDETLTVDPGTGYDTLQLDTSGGDDTIVVAAATRVNVDGSVGYDTLRIEIEDFFFTPAINPSPNNPTAIIATNIEEINTLGSGVQTLDLTSGSVQAMTDNRNELFLRIDPEDRLQLGVEWIIETPTFVDNVPAHRLTAGGATLHLVAGATWQNPLLAADVNRSGTVSALDPLLIINRLNDNAEGELPATQDAFDNDDGKFYYDVSGDGIVTALDALQAINYLNSLDALVNGEPVAASELIVSEPSHGAVIVVSAMPTTDLGLSSNARRGTDEIADASDWDQTLLDLVATPAKKISPAASSDESIESTLALSINHAGFDRDHLDSVLAGDTYDPTSPSIDRG